MFHVISTHSRAKLKLRKQHGPLNLIPTMHRVSQASHSPFFYAQDLN